MSPPGAVRRAVVVGAAVALAASVVVAVPAWAQNHEVAATPAAVGDSPPARPHSLGASAAHDEVTLTWTASTDPAVTHYAILRRDRDADAVGVFRVIEADAGPDTSYTDTSVSASGSYVYRAKAVSPTGVSQWSGYVRADTPPAPQPEPVPEPPPPVPDTTTPDEESSPDLAPNGPDDQEQAAAEHQKDADLESVEVAPRVAVFTDADSEVPRNWALAPAGLAGGDRFRLLFVTYAGHAPTSDDIDDYNTYVQSQANASNAHSAIKPYSSGFRVVGSTADDDARDNASTAYTNADKGVPIYWLNGSKVADDYEDFHDGGWDDEANPRGRNGNRARSNVLWIWTGSNNDGTEKRFTDGRVFYFGATNVSLGRLNAAGGPLDAGDHPELASHDSRSSTQQRYYALSEVFTVGGSVPVFTDSDPASRSVPENSRALTNVGDLVAATDADVGDSLTYTLGGADAASFGIGSTSGRILTKAGVTYDHETRSRYSVVVSVTDGTYSASITVMITVTDVDEPPSAAPGAPTVTATASTSHLRVSWAAPANTSHPINDYDVQYRTDGTGAWINWPHDGTGLGATIAGLAAGTAYEVQVRARNVEGVTGWSASGRATTAAATTVPLNWELKPDGAAAGGQFRLLFLTHQTFRPTSGDIGDYNAEARRNARAGHRAIRPYASGFTVVGSTDDDDARDNTGTTYTATAKGLAIYWLNGNKAADDYEDFYDGTWDDEANPTDRSGSVAFPTNGVVWTGSDSDGTAASAAFGDSSVAYGRLNGAGDPLDANASFSNVNHQSRPYYALSEVFTVGSTANSAPVFADTAPAARSVAENPGAGADVGAPVAASDADADDTVRYSLRGTDARSFAIDPSSGQIRTRAGVAYDFEAKAAYSVQVRASDGTHTATNTTDIAVTITITDVAEPPAAPRAPRVRTVAANTDRLAVHWTAPANSGPPITDYDVRYRLGDTGAWTDVAHTGTGRTATVTGLSAASIDDVAVQVRATNEEGTGAWSRSARPLYDICGRTAQVAAAILAATPGGDTCESVSWQDMAAITELRIRVTGTQTLRPADLDGLASLERLDLSGSYLGALAGDTFDNLPGLVELDLSDAGLDTLPDGIFDSLTGLIELDLSHNRHLRAGNWHPDIFGRLHSLETLRLNNMSYRGRGIKFVNSTFYNNLFDGLDSLTELDVRPSTPHLGAPLAFVPLTSLTTYNGAPYVRPADAPRSLTAAISDIAGSVIVRVRDDRGRLTGEKASFCKTVTLTWQPPAGTSGITGYKIMRTHYGHPVISQRKPNTDHRRYGYDIATTDANTTTYVHEPLRPGAAGHKFTYYIGAVTPDGVGFPAVAKVSAPIKIRWNSTGTMTTGPDELPCPMLQ
ncbi:fibronectin type III domain-containing protein [Candidatus Poriferisodalis sp.]|uniref:fibronectin type III domain-containing protein n=1 Tax=Candidatus Poriferisodalis sp. TaxID=3101277 RepID=UPI003AF8FB6A